MGKRSAASFLLVLVWVVVAVSVLEVCWCWGEEDPNVYNNAKDDDRVILGEEKAKVKAEEARQGAAETMHDAKDKADTWTDWAFGKFSE